MIATHFLYIVHGQDEEDPARELRITSAEAERFALSIDAKTFMVVIDDAEGVRHGIARKDIRYFAITAIPDESEDGDEVVIPFVRGMA